MKIAIHQPRLSYYVGGGEIVPLEQASRLSKNNDVTIITTLRENSTIFKKFQLDNPSIKIVTYELDKKIYSIPTGQNQLRWDIESYAFGQATHDFYKNSDFDILVTHYSTDSLLLPKKNTLHLHGVPSVYRDLERLSLSNTSSLISVSESVSVGWKQMHDVESTICYNGIDEKRFIPKPSNKDIDFLFIGRLIKIKGIDFLLDALNILNKNASYNLAIAGTGPEEAALKNKVYDLGLSSHVEFLGYVPDSSLVKLYNSSKICVLPSYAKEGVLTTMLESSSCAIPVITTDSCGMKEFIVSGYNGFLVKPSDHKSLYDSMNLLINNDVLRSNLGNNARNEILKNWTWDNQIRKLEQIYLQNVSENK